MPASTATRRTSPSAATSPSFRTSAAATTRRASITGCSTKPGTSARMATTRSSGRVPSPGPPARSGRWGLSFTCFNQYLTAPTRPPHLAAMFCAHSASNAYKDLYWAGGALHMIMPTWAAIAERDGAAGAARRSGAADRLRRRRRSVAAVARAAARDAFLDGGEHDHHDDDGHDRQPVLQRLLAAVRGGRALGRDRYPDHALRELVRPVSALAGGALQRHLHPGHAERQGQSAALRRALAPRVRPSSPPG